ncbi:skp1-like protein 11 [Nicotiana attenuata]|uniref:Skp1-like protein 11 n=1 Tax=Nicotiana attenuata TaxID=49451 RepID=A0A1J6ILG2_NICAT|nr:skp1-like protein 11 [Nicotiana attenuata]
MAEAEGAIHMPNVRSDTMIKVIEYWKKHSEKGISEDELNTFDKNFVKLHHLELFELVVAADFLADEELSHVTCEEVLIESKEKHQQKYMMYSTSIMILPLENEVKRN